MYPMYSENNIIEKEEMPEWLKNYKKGKYLGYDAIKEILKHRVVYYPGAGIDGYPLKFFNKQHLAHTFFYVDYLPTKEETKQELTKEKCIRGYHLLDINDVSEYEFAPEGWIPHYIPQKHEIDDMDRFIRTRHPYCLIVIYERDKKYDDTYGAERFCLIYMCGDGIATYDAVFANYNRTPYFLVLKDHGFGGNYNWFGHGGALEHIAKVTNTYPPYILNINGHCWDGYRKIWGSDCINEGMYLLLKNN